MTNNFTVRTAIIATALLGSLLSFQCTKENTDRFCEVQRETYQTVTDKEGMVRYFGQQDRYGVDLTLTDANNNETFAEVYICNMPKELQNVYLRVRVSGTLKKFNPEENIQPTFDFPVKEVYYLDVTQIAKVSN